MPWSHAGKINKSLARSISLVVRRFVLALRDAVFAAPTEARAPAEVVGGLGGSAPLPPRSTCTGGCYRLAHRHQDGSVLWISGVFDAADRPRRITCTWAHEPVGDTTDHTRVTVRFDYRGQGREVIAVHQGFRSAHSRETRGAGWGECLDRLAALACRPADLKDASTAGRFTPASCWVTGWP